MLPMIVAAADDQALLGPDDLRPDGKTLAFEATRFDDSITKALARAHRWRTLIEDGTYASITELARDKGVNESYACRLLRLTLLAPDIITTILDGRQHPDLTLKQLAKPMPIRWDQQLIALRGTYGSSSLTS